MSYDRRKFINGVASGFLSYNLLKARALASVSDANPMVGAMLETSNLQIDISFDPRIWRQLGDPVLLIQLNPSAHPDGTIKPGQPISLTWEFLICSHHSPRDQTSATHCLRSACSAAEI